MPTTQQQLPLPRASAVTSGQTLARSTSPPATNGAPAAAGVAALSASVAQETWFFGSISSGDAGALLAGRPPLTFLLRASQTSLVVSAVTKDGLLRHTIVSHNGVGFVFAGQSLDKFAPFDSVQELVKFLIRVNAVKIPLDRRAAVM